MANHIYGSDNYAAEGESYEDKAMSYFTGRGYDVKKATTQQNKEGVDYFVGGKSVDHKVRGGAVFIEIHLGSKDAYNSSYNNGWLFGPAKYIIFTNRSTGISKIVLKSRLRAWYLDNEEFLTNRGRRGYDEKLVIIPTEDLDAIVVATFSL